MRLSLTLAPDLSAPASARTSIRALGLSLSPAVLCDVQLVVSELVANAVTHGPRESIRVDLELVGRDVVRGEVVDQGVAGARAIEREEHDPDNLGLRVVDELTTAWGARAGSTHVWFEIGPAG